MAISTGLALLGGAILSSAVQSNAASQASSAQIVSADRGISEQRRQFNEVQKLLAPFVTGGTTAFGQQMALTGAAGADAQRAAIQAIEQGPEFTALARQGENAILQQASATGGLRGGNVQGALAQFRPQILSGLIEQQYSRLGGLATAGQNAAAGVGTAGMQTGQNISSLMQQQGAARAGSALAQGQAFGNLIGSAGMAIGRGMAYQGYTPQGASAPLTFGQGMFYGGGAF
jgi:hypothetical protein